jgi:hypothetical protein
VFLVGAALSFVWFLVARGFKAHYSHG